MTESKRGGFRINAGRRTNEEKGLAPRMNFILQLRMSDEMGQWITENGGSSFCREIFAREMNAKEASK